MRNDRKFCIDFFEFAFLVEACIPPNPIARSMFWDRVVEEHYHELTDDERARLYEWIGRNPAYQHGLERGNEGCQLFEARFNPETQYRVTATFEGKTETYDCFLLNGKYHTSKSTSVVEEYITKTEPLWKSKQ